MKLIKFRVREFRSIQDSGWIECDDVTTLVGMNEAGKSNLLLALWKLKPAKGGEISLLDDLPKKKYAELRDAEEKPVFIEAEFELDADTLSSLQKRLQRADEALSVVTIGRNYSGEYAVSFPTLVRSEAIDADTVTGLLQQAKIEFEGMSTVPNIAGALDTLTGCAEQIKDHRELDSEALRSLVDSLTPRSRDRASVKAVLNRLTAHLNKISDRISAPLPHDIDGLPEWVVEQMPSFVYYSNYGNLSSEIYLPHVIQNLNRTDLSGVAEAQARTLRVLFEFVNLDPQEILQLGKEPEPQRNQQGLVISPVPLESIAAAAQAKTEREVLLQSASAKLTSRFKEWWKQGDYIFDFRADGNHFRIWVSDSLRPEKVELEGRSTGLQWFLSFFLVFLVEGRESHKGAVLLLDEAGLSLHPLAQRDLARFFENLSKTNQILHTTHSPFLISADHVDRVKLVYVDDDGYTVASNDLRASTNNGKQSKSIYSVHAALGLSVSDALLQGCRVIVVEGASDQFYLTGIKNYLISERQLAPKEELVFVPSGGVRGVESVASILSAKDDGLPVVLVDSDGPGRDYKAKLLERLYRGSSDLVVEIGDVLPMKDAEMEDLIPYGMLQQAVHRLFRDVEEDIDDTFDRQAPIIPQIESFADAHAVQLPKGWKVELARAGKQRLAQQREKVLNPDTMNLWTRLFAKFSGT